MKAKRQGKIIEIIEKYDIETQDELAEKLLEEGFPTTQATISRDIREMKLTKLAYSGGKQKYIAIAGQDFDTTQKYKRVINDGILTMEAAQNIIVVKTISGMAMAVAAALDSIDINGLVGCIAGDDTVMCVIRSNELTSDVIHHIGKFLNNRNDQQD